MTVLWLVAELACVLALVVSLALLAFLVVLWAAQTVRLVHALALDARDWLRDR